MNKPSSYRNIDCTRCDERLVSIRGADTVFHGRRPIDLTARPAEQQAIIVALQKKIEALEKESTVLTTRLDQVDRMPDGILARVQELEAKDKARDLKMASIEKLLESSDKPATRTISLKAE